jgi:hypothetical protein
VAWFRSPGVSACRWRAEMDFFSEAHVIWTNMRISLPRSPISRTPRSCAVTKEERTHEGPHSRPMHQSDWFSTLVARDAGIAVLVFGNRICTGMRSLFWWSVLKLPPVTWTLKISPLRVHVTPRKAAHQPMQHSSLASFGIMQGQVSSVKVTTIEEYFQYLIQSVIFEHL